MKKKSCSAAIIVIQKIFNIHDVYWTEGVAASSKSIMKLPRLSHAFVSDGGGW